ncbi:MAG: adenosylcobinamide-phosphate synthase CbiB [Bryobacteraceae bacterium]
MMVTPLQLTCGLAADLLLGDPHWLPHPIVALGKFAAVMERLWRALLPARTAGVAAWISVVSVACGFVYFTLRLVPEPWIQIYWIYSLVALRSLDDHARAVIAPLRGGDLDAARRAVGMIVGRDTQSLDEREVTRAVVETVAENLSDGVIAPLFWLVLGGPVAMAAYKAINTLDSMFGHKSDRYREFGWCSARIDDAANWIPARLTAALIWIVAAVWPGLDFARSVRATWRDAHRQPSPNSGYPEAAAAGAIGVRLGGVNHYRGVRSEKSFLGEDVRPLDWRAWPPMRAILYASTALFTCLALGAASWR